MKQLENKVIIVIGASCSGKSSFTYNTYVKGKDYKTIRDLMPITETDDYYLIGKFDADKRRKGSDTINRHDIPLMIEQIERLIKTGKSVVVEGVRICSYKRMDYLADNFNCQLYYMKSSFDTSLSRNLKLGFTSSETSLKRDVTLSENFFRRYADRMNGLFLDTNNIQDFNELNYDNYSDKFCKIDDGIELW